MSDDSDDDGRDWDNYDSGPFCRHWGDPSDCDIKCANCGHRCVEHEATEGLTECNACNYCNEWKEQL